MRYGEVVYVVVVLVALERTLDPVDDRNNVLQDYDNYR